MRKYPRLPRSVYVHRMVTVKLSGLWSGLGPGGVLGPKNDGGVPLAAENWTQKDQGKN